MRPLRANDNTDARLWRSVAASVMPILTPQLSAETCEEIPEVCQTSIDESADLVPTRGSAAVEAAAGDDICAMSDVPHDSATLSTHSSEHAHAEVATREEPQVPAKISPPVLSDPFSDEHPEDEVELLRDMTGADMAKWWYNRWFFDHMTLDDIDKRINRERIHAFISGALGGSILFLVVACGAAMRVLWKRRFAAEQRVAPATA